MKALQTFATNIYTRILYLCGKQKQEEPLVELKTDKNSHIVNQFNQKIILGSRVIVRGNEPDNLGIATITEFYDCEGKWREPIPVVVYEGDDKTPYLCMAIVILYNEELFNFLLNFPAIEQWNILARDYNQLDEKYGVKYRTVDEIRKTVTIPSIC